MAETHKGKDFEIKMSEEFENFIKVWICAVISVTYCYYIPTKIKAGLLRFLFVLPICALFLLFPLFLPSNGYFSFITFFFLSGLATSKLYLFAFKKGPLLPLPSNLPKFIFLVCFPIKLQQNPNPKKQNQNHFPKLIFSIKVVTFGVLLHVYDYKQNLPQILLFVLYSLQFYLEHEILLTIIKALFTITFGYELEPHFNEPYLATSLQDFWGRRWNLMVTVILRQAVYIPVRRICDGRINSDLGRFLGMLAVFIVSGLSHELYFFTVTFEMPTGEVTLFFLLHGICTAVEVAVKRTRFARRCVVRAAVSRLLTVGFLVLSGGLLFFPPLVRNNVMERRAKEILFFFDFLKRKSVSLLNLII